MDHHGVVTVTESSYKDAQLSAVSKLLPLLPPSAQDGAGGVRARAHGARLLQVPGRVLQGLNPVPGGGGKSERVGERKAEEKTHGGSWEKKLRGHFLSLPRTGRSSDDYLKWNQDGLSPPTLVSEIYQPFEVVQIFKPLVRVLPKPAKECTGEKSESISLNTNQAGTRNRR